MRKKIFLILLFFIIFITACGKSSEKNDVLGYLKSNYSDEEFEIVSSEYIENVGGSCNRDENSKYKKDGYKYIVKSNTTNIIFQVEDIYESRSGGFCSYDLKDNYLQNALEKYINEYNDLRISLGKQDYSSSAKGKVDYSDFNSIDEISNVLFGFKNYYENKKPFIDSADVSVAIYNSGKHLGNISLSYNNREKTLNDIKLDISNLLK